MISAFWAWTSWLLENVWLTSRTTVCGLVVRRYHCRDQTLELTSPLCCRVILDKTVDLPPHSESLAPVKIQGHLLMNGKWGILESDGSHSIDGVMTGRTLVDLEKPTVPVRILNLTNKEKRNKNSA